MNDRIKEAFRQVQAEGELKNKTRAFIFQKTNGYKRVKAVNPGRFAAAFACLALLLTGGYRIYFTPTVEISIDINPSVELGVNRFNRIISFEGYNDDGRELTASLDLKFLDYSEAVNRIVESEDVASLLSEDEVMMIVVTGTDRTQSEEVLERIEFCTAGTDNAYCSYAQPKEVAKAHEAGLSYGKYRAYVELQALDPAITVEEIRSMTMREIRDRINSLSSDGENGADPFGNGNGRQENGRQGKGNGRGQKNRRGNTNNE